MPSPIETPFAWRGDAAAPGRGGRGRVCEVRGVFPSTAHGEPGVAGAALASLAPQAEIQGGSGELLAPNRCLCGAERGLTSSVWGGGGGEPAVLRDGGVRLPAPQLGPAGAGDDTWQAALPSASGAVGGAGTEELMCS